MHASHKNNLTRLSDWLLDQGVVKIFGRQLAERYILIKDLMTHEFCYKVESSIKQFCEGLGPMYDQVKRSPGATAQLFVYTNNNLRKADLKKTYTITYSLEGSNNRTQEEDTMYSFETFLLECEANSTGVSLSEVLEFWIGAEDIPPYGLQMPLLIDFYSTTPGIRHLPSAHTFMPVLWLPGVLEILMI